MAFGYMGAKHGLARFYPSPIYDTVIEPFAGAAGYSCYWAQRRDLKVILIDKNSRVVALWHRLQQMSERQLFTISDPIKGERTTEPLIAAASGEQGMAVLNGKSRQITDRMVATWPRARDRIALLLPLIKKWKIFTGVYSDAPRLEATWFIDPPYVSKLGANGVDQTAGGAMYVYKGGVGFDTHVDLASWVRRRTGQVIVCEQMPADWLPFVAFRNQRNGVGAGTQSTRTEAIYTQGGDA